VLHFCGLSGTLDGAPKWVDRSFVAKKEREQKWSVCFLQLHLKGREDKQKGGISLFVRSSRSSSSRVWTTISCRVFCSCKLWALGIVCFSLVLFVPAAAAARRLQLLLREGLVAGEL
jgi:hypothetical protein